MCQQAVRIFNCIVSLFTLPSHEISSDVIATEALNCTTYLQQMTALLTPLDSSSALLCHPKEVLFKSSSSCGQISVLKSCQVCMLCCIGLLKGALATNYLAIIVATSRSAWDIISCSITTLNIWALLELVFFCGQMF